MSKIAENLDRVKTNIADACAKSRRNPSDVRLIVVTKKANIEAIKEVVTHQCCELGENRVQHLKLVHDEITQFLTCQPQPGIGPEDIKWHMIGHLQRNKCRQLLKLSNFIHSVDTLRLAEEISKAAVKTQATPSVLLQVNCSLEPQKYGAPVGAAVHLAEQITEMPNLRLSGLMTMGPLTDDQDAIRTCFARAREIFEDIRKESFCGPEFRHLSMGMSHDYQIAIEEGATMIRIGSAIFS